MCVRARVFSLPQPGLVVLCVFYYCYHSVGKVCVYVYVFEFKCGTFLLCVNALETTLKNDISGRLK